mmetsp:Transcript_10565/g.43107  ORF Transcript_10565/g.43107 Transcript_10565/m.43107 type:complete len:300 (-) Transcript_10565:1707-2606(-)
MPPCRVVIITVASSAPIWKIPFCSSPAEVSTMLPAVNTSNPAVPCMSTSGATLPSITPPFKVNSQSAPEAAVNAASRLLPLIPILLDCALTITESAASKITSAVLDLNSKLLVLVNWICGALIIASPLLLMKSPPAPSTVTLMLDSMTTAPTLPLLTKWPGSSRRSSPSERMMVVPAAAPLSDKLAPIALIVSSSCAWKRPLLPVIVVSLVRVMVASFSAYTRRPSLSSIAAAPTVDSSMFPTEVYAIQPLSNAPVASLLSTRPLNPSITILPSPETPRLKKAAPIPATLPPMLAMLLM